MEKWRRVLLLLLSAVTCILFFDGLFAAKALRNLSAFDRGIESAIVSQQVP